MNAAAATPRRSRRWPLALLGPAAWLYRRVAALRNTAYERGLFKRHAAAVPVVSIGNLTFGGTGKTPATIWLAGELAARGRAVGIVSRGYGGVRGVEPLVVARDGSLLADASAAGDEPFLIAREARARCVVVGRDRVAAARAAVAAGADVLLLDDGFQHRRLDRCCEIVLVDGAAPLRGRPRSPAEFLREPASGLRRADLVLATHIAVPFDRLGRFLVGDERPASLARVLDRLPERARPPVAAAAHRAVEVLRPDGSVVPPEWLADQPVLAVSGLARPAGFEETLRGLGAIVLMHLAYPDHHPFDAGDAATIAQRAAETSARCIVTTAKDAVRWPAAAPPAAVLRIALDVPAREAVLARVVERIDSAAARAAPGSAGAAAPHGAT